MKTNFNKAKVFLLTIASFAILSGCSITKNKASSDTNIKVTTLIAHYCGQNVLRFNNDSLNKIQFEGNFSVGHTNIKYQNGLKNQAKFIAEKFNSLYSHVESETGIDFKANPQVYLLRVQKQPQNLDIQLKTEDPNIFPIPMFMEIDRDDANLILIDNPFFPYSLVHEMTEVSLAYPDDKGAVKIGDKRRFLIFIFSFDSYTRWFREGFASYAGYVALDYLRSNSDENLTKIWGTALVNQTPFSSLSVVGKKLFRWEQNLNQKIKGDYYSAALGLFLLMEDRFGRDAIKDAVSKLNDYKNLDGSDIIKIINKKLDTDIEKLAEEFKFIKMGIQYQQLTPVLALNKGLEQKNGFYVTAIEPNSIAAKAGIEVNDVIVSLNDRPIKTRLDLELALFKTVKNSKLKIQIWRTDEGLKEIHHTFDKFPEITAKESKEPVGLNYYSITCAIIQSIKKK